MEEGRSENLCRRQKRQWPLALALYLVVMGFFVAWDVLHPSPANVLKLAEGATLLTLFVLERWNRLRGLRRSVLLSRLGEGLTLLTLIVVVLTYHF